jgi:hypothetical protein
MSRKSRNNRRITQGRFTTNPTQYIQFQNRNKYMHVMEGEHIIIINRNTQDTKALFDYEEVCKYLEINSIDLDIKNMYRK